MPFASTTTPFHEDKWAAAWARFSPLIEPALVPPLLNALEPEPGEQILDIGTGAAPVAIEAARLVSPGGSVLAIDISAPMLERASARARAAALENVSFACLDGATARFPGEPFDLATSLLGVMFFNDPVAAFANIRRAVRPGGRFAFLTWAAAQDNPLLPEVLLAPWRSSASTGNSPGAFSLSDPARIRAALAASGWSTTSVDTLRTQVILDACDAWDPAWLDVYRVPADSRQAASEHVDRSLRTATRSQGVHMPLAANVTLAWNPPG